MTPEQARKLEEVYSFMQSLKSSTTIPFEVDRAFRDRFRDIIAIGISAKGTDTEDVTVVSSVNFGGSTVGTTVVLNDPDGWLTITVNGTAYHVPRFDS